MKFRKDKPKIGEIWEVKFLGVMSNKTHHYKVKILEDNKSNFYCEFIEYLAEHTANKPNRIYNDIFLINKHFSKRLGICGAYEIQVRN